MDKVIEQLSNVIQKDALDGALTKQAAEQVTAALAKNEELKEEVEGLKEGLADETKLIANLLRIYVAKSRSEEMNFEIQITQYDSTVYGPQYGFVSEDEEKETKG